VSQQRTDPGRDSQNVTLRTAFTWPLMLLEHRHSSGLNGAGKTTRLRSHRTLRFALAGRSARQQSVIL
jgi:ABC-type molybdenum transport system ATPase subunit/photorepair protein PhrA